MLIFYTRNVNFTKILLYNKLPDFTMIWSHGSWCKLVKNGYWKNLLNTEKSKFIPLVYKEKIIIIIINVKLSSKVIYEIEIFHNNVTGVEEKNGFYYYFDCLKSWMLILFSFNEIKLFTYYNYLGLNPKIFFYSFFHLINLIGFFEKILLSCVSSLNYS